MTSSLGLSDEIIINDINYETLPDNFTPGVGGTYKRNPPPYKPPEEVVASWDEDVPSPACEHTYTAGYRTASYCTPKTVTCDLKRSYEPERIIDPGRLDYLAREVAAKKKASMLSKMMDKENIDGVDRLNTILAVLFILAAAFLFLKLMR